MSEDNLSHYQTKLNDGAVVSIEFDGHATTFTSPMCDFMVQRGQKSFAVSDIKFKSRSIADNPQMFDNDHQTVLSRYSMNDLKLEITLGPAPDFKLRQLAVFKKYSYRVKDYDSYYDQTGSCHTEYDWQKIYLLTNQFTNIAYNLVNDLSYCQIRQYVGEEHYEFSRYVYEWQSLYVAHTEQVKERRKKRAEAHKCHEQFVASQKIQQQAKQKLLSITTVKA